MWNGLLFGSTEDSTTRLTDRPLTTKVVCELVKQRLKYAGLLVPLSPRSFFVTAIPDLREQGGADLGRAIPYQKCWAAYDDALCPAEEEGRAEHRRADSGLIGS